MYKNDFDPEIFYNRVVMNIEMFRDFTDKFYNIFTESNYIYINHQISIFNIYKLIFYKIYSIHFTNSSDNTEYLIENQLNYHIIFFGGLDDNINKSYTWILFLFLDHFRSNE